MAYRSTLLASACLLSLSAMPATAQIAPVGVAPDEVAETEAAKPPALGDIVVTGSRVGRSRLETLAPVDVIGASTLTRQGTPELGAALANVAPSITFPRPAITDGTDSVRPATLRGLAPDQTLVLLNGVRQHSSALVNVNGSIGRGSSAVDLNTIPVIALDTVEVLRDGASAQYGSDAIAGVVNLRLREARSGGGITSSIGVYSTDVKTARIPNGYHRNDGANYSVAGWQGFGIGAEGFVTVSAEYIKREPTSRGDLDPRVTTPRITSRFGDPEVESEAVVINAGIPLTSDLDLYGLGAYQHRYSESAGFPRLENNINNTNIATGRPIVPGGFLPLIGTTIDDFTVGGGIKGDVSGFNVNANVTYGKNRLHFSTLNSLNGSLGASSPRNFDSGALSYDQLTAGLDVVRPIEIGLDKPLALAFGAQFRREGYAIEAGELNSYVYGPDRGGGRAAGAQLFPGFRPSNEVDRHRNSYSLYADLDAPLFTGFDIDVAGRYEHYADFGSTATGKVAARYDFAPAFAIRGAVSTGFRAPSLQQQFFTSTAINFLVINGVSTPVDVVTFPVADPVARALGSQPLKPEKSTNLSAGFVFHTGGFELTVDAYHIKIRDRIVLSENILGSAPGTPGASATAVAIYNLLNSTGSTQTYGGGRFFINGVDTTTKGVDIVARYRFDTNGLGRFDLNAAINLNDTKIDKLPTTNQLSSLPVPPALFARVNQLTFEKGTPRQKYVLGTDWSNAGPFSATARLNIYGSVLVPQTSAALDYETGTHALLDLEGRFKAGDHFTFALGAQNLLDAYPDQTPAAVNSTGAIAYSSYSPFGFNGRYVYARVGITW
ncbi:iron complex outermembrane receptor protein [Sphingomonas sp. SORGH_AS 950]|uniref:TonB-dependent receptor plug domain-containing protein n=1 Tax=Sphingomonas sp. SORGH_AS_0950 TaxID=3041792 RepID=UPI00277FB378|nr:TonB-dependent receptor [Sphingomonas sp. SORGH_AS_0950]MDQ1159008.1 iron complex outermembrane receptor protein [Sphingomonas sp. SORGH_AS_0950]